MIEFWRMIRGVYGMWIAAIVVVAVLGIAFYLGMNPSTVISWMGK